MPSFGTANTCIAALLSLSFTCGAARAEPAGFEPHEEAAQTPGFVANGDEMDAAPASDTALASTATDTDVAALIKPDSFLILEMPTDKLVRMVARQYGLVPHISDRVRGKVSNIRLQGNLEEMMASVAAASDIDWLVFEGSLEVSAKDESIVRFVPLNDLTFQDAQRVLKDANLDPARFGVQPVADGGAVKVSGPPKAVEVVEALFALTAAQATPLAADKAIIVRRGTFKDVETYGEGAAVQLVEDREAGRLNPPDPAPVVDETAATGEGPKEEKPTQ